MPPYLSTPLRELDSLIHYFKRQEHSRDAKLSTPLRELDSLIPVTAVVYLVNVQESFNSPEGIRLIDTLHIAKRLGFFLQLSTPLRELDSLIPAWIDRYVRTILFFQLP